MILVLEVSPYVELLILYERWACMNVVLGRGLFLRWPYLRTVGLTAQFQCRLFRLDRALIFGALVDSWVLSLGHWEDCLVGMVGFTVSHWCSSLSTSVYWLRTVWSWTHLQAFGGFSCGLVFLDHLSVLFGYPEGSVLSLVAGTLKMRYCSANFL